MRTAHDILSEARQLGLTVRRKGDKLGVSPADRCPPELVAELRQHKVELLELLSVELPPDCIPWLHIAKQVVLGDWGGADRSTRKSLLIGLRSINHPTCRRATELLSQEN